MSLILSGSDGLSDVDGSAATPAIRGTDANTGIFFPAADTIAFAEGGAEAMRIDSSGNVGIGTTSPVSKLNIVDASNTVNVRLESGSVIGQLFSSTSGGGVYLDANSSHPLVFRTAGTERGRFDTSGNLQFNSGYGSVATAYGCRAWVNFNGTGTVAIRGSGNVTSITDNGTGDYTVNFTTAMPDTNFSVCASSNEFTDTFNGGQRVANCSIPSSSSARIGITFQNGGVGDQPIVCVAIFR